MRKLEQSLNANHYELEDLLNKPYNTNGIPKPHTKLKVKEFQLTIDLVHQVAAKHGNFNDDVSSQVVEYIVSFDPKQDITCYDMYDMLKSMI